MALTQVVASVYINRFATETTEEHGKINQLPLSLREKGRKKGGQEKRDRPEWRLLIVVASVYKYRFATETTEEHGKKTKKRKSLYLSPLPIPLGNCSCITLPPASM
jgi:hypothetical protein